MEEAVTRLKLAANIGADVCFIEGVKTRELLVSTVSALAPKPVCYSKNFSFFILSDPTGSCQCHIRWFDAIFYQQRGRRNGSQNYKSVSV